MRTMWKLENTDAVRKYEGLFVARPSIDIDTQIHKQTLTHTKERMHTIQL
jgi:hypothetical protein